MPKSHHVRVSFALSLIVGFAGCAQQPVKRDAEPYRVDISEHGVTISHAETVGIPMAEFIKFGQMVTGKTFTYSKSAVADRDVRVIGTIKLTRKEFFEFFQTMLYVKGLACTSRGEGDASVVEIKPIRKG